MSFISIFELARAAVRDWTNSAATALLTISDKISAPRTISLVEGDDGHFFLEMDQRNGKIQSRITFADGVLIGDNLETLVKGNRVHLILNPRRFLFRPFELPSRAAGFLDGIVRAQIDRLTPWTADSAVFGCTAPIATGTQSMTTVVAATTRNSIAAYADAVAVHQPNAVAVFAGVSELTGMNVRVFERNARGRLYVARLGNVMAASLLLMIAVAVLSLVIATYVTNDLTTRQDDLARQISQQRAALRSGNEGTDWFALSILERRKHQMPASVVVLDALTRVLPDHTYVTEFNLVGDRLQIIGITKDAPSLIPLIEQSAIFERATFYAPTTRSASDPGERFHIETRIKAR